MQILTCVVLLSYSLLAINVVKSGITVKNIKGVSAMKRAKYANTLLYLLYHYTYSRIRHAGTAAFMPKD